MCGSDLNNPNFPDVTYDELLASHSLRSTSGKPASQTSVIFVFGGKLPYGGNRRQPNTNLPSKLGL